MTDYDTDYKTQMKQYKAQCREYENRIQAAKLALRVIHTWATYRQGENLDPENVRKLCEKTLKELG